jgi:hypothetical protein
VTAVVLNVAVTAPVGPGHVTVWPGGARPVASSLNFERAGQTIANQVIAPVDAAGTLRLHTTTATHLVVDVSGFFTTEGVVSVPGSPDRASAGRLTTVPGTRLIDTRTPGSAPVAAGSTLTVPVVGRAPVPPDATAVAVTIVAVVPAGAGHLTAWKGTGIRPPTSTLNFAPGQVIANQAFVPLGPAGSFAVYAASTTHVVVDINGFFTGSTTPASSTGLFSAVTPYRALDTRLRSLRVSAASPFEIDLGGSGWSAVALNLAVTATASAAHLTAWDSRGPRPAVSTMNYDAAGQTRAAAATVAGGGDTRIAVCAAAETHLIVDVAGFYSW